LRFIDVAVVFTCVISELSGGIKRRKNGKKRNTTKGRKGGERGRRNAESDEYITVVERST
jgi:hypothetical protein